MIRSSRKLIQAFRCSLRPRNSHCEMSSAPIASVLDQHSTKKYFIELNVFRSNHLSHGIVALDRLGVPLERIEKFVDWYIPKLEPPVEEEESRDVKDLLGERVGYYKIFSYFEELLKNQYHDNIDELIAAEYPKLSAGLAGSALHGTIHLGYGYAARNSRLVLEGLSYVYHSYRPIVAEGSTLKDRREALGSGSLSIAEALSVVAENTALRQAAVDGIQEKRWNSLKIGMFQKRVSYLLTLHGSKLCDYVDCVKIPDTVLHEDGTIDPVKLNQEVVIWCITAYTLAENKNDFFLLHGVTCCWALYRIMPLLSNKDGFNTMYDFLVVLVAAYIAQGSPALSECIPDDVDVSDSAWSTLITSSLSEDRDEHCYKLIQVSREMAKERPEHAKLCMKAAMNVLAHEFHF